jgi:transcriptional regulator with GAF, ATPase, and Fis domain
VALDCGALPDTLAESELFGHKKGAFTDAKEDKPGLFELANRGTLFLDEVTNLSLRSQAKLLRVLQERRVRRLGSTKERKVDVRIIAASNSNLEEETTKGNFRQDLYHRLKVMEIELPPLRERRGDIPLLVQYFIESNSVQRKLKVEGITTDALRILSSYGWPGNVRQLKNEIERAIILTDDGWITDNLFSKAVRKTRPKRTRATYDIKQMVKVLKDSGWVKRSAAKKLGIPESTLRRRLRVHGIDPPKGS